MLESKVLSAISDIRKLFGVCVTFTAITSHNLVLIDSICYSASRKVSIRCNINSSFGITYSIYGLGRKLEDPV
jgi:hypothetical protein